MCWFLRLGMEILWVCKHNGTQGPTTPHYDSETGAGEWAIQELFAELPKGKSDCNCGFLNNYKVQECVMNLELCFRFANSGDVSNSKPEWLAWATPINNKNVTGYYCCDYNETVAAEYAITDLFNLDSSCFMG